MSAKTAFALGCALLAVVWGKAFAEEEFIYAEQDYNIADLGKEGSPGKDTRQRIYISKDWLCIDEFGGQDRNKPSEGFMIDFKGKQIIQLDHQAQKKITESFETRRKRIEKSKKETEDDLRDQPPGKTKDKLKKLYRPMLDDKTRFGFPETPGEPHTILGETCVPIKVVDLDDPKYAPFSAQMHPTLELPYDNAESLYLMKIIGKGMSEFIKANKDRLKFIPMELHLELAAGGHLDTKVVNIGTYDKKAIIELREKLGNPFEVPANYEEQKKVKIQTPKADEIP